MSPGREERTPQCFQAQPVAGPGGRPIHTWFWSAFRAPQSTCENDSKLLPDQQKLRIRKQRQVRVSLNGCLVAGCETGCDARPLLENSTACQVVDAILFVGWRGRAFGLVVLVGGFYWLMQASFRQWGVSVWSVQLALRGRFVLSVSSLLRWRGCF